MSPLSKTKASWRASSLTLCSICHLSLPFPPSQPLQAGEQTQLLLDLEESFLLQPLLTIYLLWTPTEPARICIPLGNKDREHSKSSIFIS